MEQELIYWWAGGKPMEGLPNIDNSNLERNSYLQFILGVNFDHFTRQAYLFWD